MKFFIVALSILTLIFGGSLTLNLFYIEFSKDYFKFEISINVYWIYNYFLGVIEPKSKFSLKINEFTLFEIESGIWNLISKNMINNAQKEFQTSNQVENPKSELQDQKKMSEINFKSSSESIATFANIYDYTDNNQDITDTSLINEIQKERDETKEYLDKKYEVSTFYNGECTEQNLLNSLENDKPDIFLYFGHGSEEGLATNDFSIYNPNYLTPTEIGSVSSLPNGLLAMTIACQSATNEDLMNAFFNIGYKTFIGFKGDVQTDVGNYFMERFFYHAIIKGESVKTAYLNANSDGWGFVFLTMLPLMLGIIGTVGSILAIRIILNLPAESKWGKALCILGLIGIISAITLVISLFEGRAGVFFLYDSQLEANTNVNAEEIYL